MGSEWYCEGGAKPDGLVILRNQSKTLLSIRIPAAVFISVIVYPPTLQFVTNSFFLKNARAYCTFYIYLAKPVSKVYVSNNRSNTDSYPQDIHLHSRMVNKKWLKIGTQKHKSYLKSLSVEYHFKPLMRDTRLTRLISFNAPGISEMKRSTFHCSTSCIFFGKNGEKQKQVQRCK